MGHLESLERCRLAELPALRGWWAAFELELIQEGEGGVPEGWWKEFRYCNIPMFITKLILYITLFGMSSQQLIEAQ